MKGLVHPKMKILSLIVTLMLFQTYTIFIHLQNFFLMKFESFNTQE